MLKKILSGAFSVCLFGTVSSSAVGCAQTAEHAVEHKSTLNWSIQLSMLNNNVFVNDSGHVELIKQNIFSWINVDKKTGEQLLMDPTFASGLDDMFYKQYGDSDLSLQYLPIDVNPENCIVSSMVMAYQLFMKAFPNTQFKSEPVAFENEGYFLMGVTDHGAPFVVNNGQFVMQLVLQPFHLSGQNLITSEGQPVPDVLHPAAFKLTLSPFKYVDLHVQLTV